MDRIEIIGDTESFALLGVRYYFDAWKNVGYQVHLTYQQVRRGRNGNIATRRGRGRERKRERREREGEKREEHCDPLLD